MFEDYKRAVLDSYLTKKATHQLSSNLENPNRTKLRRECLVVLAERHSKEDDAMLRSFFDPANKFNDPIKSIEKFDLDKFRPLINFLTKDINIRNEEPVKLLAWLIDYESYSVWRSRQDGVQPKDLETSDNAKPIEDVLPKGPLVAPTDLTENHDYFEREQGTEKEEKLEDEMRGKDGGESSSSNGFTMLYTGNSEQDGSGDGPPQIPIDEPKNEPLPVPALKIIMLCMVALVVGIGAFQFRGNKNDKIISLFTNQECMYWTGDHYQPIACDKKIGDTPVIALDTQKVTHLKRITRPDTITENSLGKVWYVKVNDIPEFYTDSGTYPMDIKKRLKPMTQYILDKYLSK